MLAIASCGGGGDDGDGGVSEATGVVIGTVDPDTSVIIKDSYFVSTKKSAEGLYTYESATDVNTYTLVCGEDNTVIPDAIIVASGEEYRAATRGANVVIFEDIVYDNADPTKQYGAVRLWETGKLTVEGAEIEKLDSRACMTKAGRVARKITKNQKASNFGLRLF